MARERIQKGSIRREERRGGPVWVFRFYVDREPDGHRVEKNLVLGTLKELPSEARAWKKVTDRDLLFNINKPNYQEANITFGFLAQQYVDRVLGPDQIKLSHTTAASYRMWIRNYIQPRWTK